MTKVFDLRLTSVQRVLNRSGGHKKPTELSIEVEKAKTLKEISQTHLCSTRVNHRISLFLETLPHGGPPPPQTIEPAKVAGDRKSMIYCTVLSALRYCLISFMIIARKREGGVLLLLFSDLVDFLFVLLDVGQHLAVFVLSSTDVC